MSKNSAKKATASPVKFKEGDKVLCVEGMQEAFADGDIVLTGQVYTVREVDRMGVVWLEEEKANKTRWRNVRFVPATSLMKELI